MIRAYNGHIFDIIIKTIIKQYLQRNEKT